MRKSLIIAAALLLAPAVSQAKTLEDLLAEKGVITKAEARGATSSAASKVYWNEGTRFDFPDAGFTASIATFLQERYTYTDNDDDGGAKDTSSFEQKKARIVISGTVLHNEFSYYLQPDFVGEEEDGESKPSLKDAYVRWNACDWGALQMGQYKTFISRQYVNSDWKLQFPDRTVVSDFFDLDRSQGLSGMLWSEDKMFELKAGIFNGESDNEGINRAGIDTKHTGIVAVRVNPMGKMNAFEEADVDYTEDMALSFGAAYAYSALNTATGDDGTVLEDGTRHTASVDASMKVQGFSLNAEFYWARYETDSMVGNQEPIGFYGQAGYFLSPKKFEAALRYSLTDCDDGKASWGMCAGNDSVGEVGVALNYYWWKHYLKGSLAYTYVNEDVTEGDDVKTNKWMFQLSSYF